MVDNRYSLDELQAWLLAYIGEAAACARGPSASVPFCQVFAQMASDPDWHGSVILNVPLSARDTLPPDLSWVVCQLPGDALVAHHIAFDRPLIASATSTPTQISAFVSYPAPPDDGAGSPILRARFANSVLVDLQHTAAPVDPQQA